MLVAATDKGVCAISLGDRDTVLESSLREEFPATEIRRNGAELDIFVQTILRHLNGNQPRLDLPLDVRATAFQGRVWKALQTIPYGQTRSYSQIAKVIRRPTAVRAVARACATNPIALLIPCHRVVREDGKLGGYRWGLKRKIQSLEREKRK
jgi:AraC family transcriptional regulator of adaptative response/methylated-DNA-[protein]-cysteine methyltransferase